MTESENMAIDIVEREIEIDSKHSLFWHDNGFKLYFLQIKEKDAFTISITKDGETQSTFLTGNDFSSLLCEAVKYCLDLPVQARGIPCPVTLLEKLHGCIKTMDSKIDENGKMVVTFDERWMKYHGDPEDVVLVWDKETGVIYIKPVESPRVKDRTCPYCGTILSKNDEGIHKER